MDKELETRPLQRYSFVLSLWPETGPYPHSRPAWRTSLEDPMTLQRWGFKNLTELIRFLEQWIAEQPPEAGEKSSNEKYPKEA
jgi:hypothetical protein